MNDKIKSWLGAGSLDLFGSPFSGKDTQGQILADIFGGALIGGGDILRSHHDPAAIEKIMAEGGIIPSDFYLDMVVPYLSRAEFHGRPLILSAVGRAHGEEPIIEKATRESGHPLKAVVLLDLREEEIWRRFEASQAAHDRGDRADDSREVLDNRLKKFREKTLPVIDYYRAEGLLIEIEGARSKGQVTEAIMLALLERAGF